MIQSTYCVAYNKLIYSNHLTGVYMRYCNQCSVEFKNFGRETGCSLKCKLLDGIKKEGDCWLYKNSSSGEYSKIRWKMKWYSAHRVSYEVHKGEIPKGKWICHKCDTPKCVNPEHLFIGSASENRKDAVSKKRVPAGEYNHFSRFTDIQVEEMRKLYDEGLTYDRLARIFNCSFTYVKYIIGNKIRQKEIKK